MTPDLHSLYETADNPNAYAFVEQVVITKRAVSYELWCRELGLDPIPPGEDMRFSLESHLVTCKVFDATTPVA
jgi:hypothetical protein